jgi:tetratricopeptide (TPR) repeat protein
MADWDSEANELFLRALEITDPSERRRFLDAACVADPARRARVDGLLRASEQAGSFLGRPALVPERTGMYVPVAALSVGPGTVIGPYKLIEEIAEGGMGTVYLAQQQEPVRRLVAVKLIKPGMDSKQVLARFEAERQALALMDHPNIARVLDAGATPDGRPYFVMELVKGDPITKYCDEKRLTPRQRLELFAHVCQAVQHAHQKGVIHRDLKPSNVLVAPYDGRPVVKVIDFGVAKAAGQPLTERTLVTGLGAVVGTLEYMSPEQAELNNADIDTRSDVYSLGVLLYELLTGTTPLTRKRLKEAALLEVLRAVREEEPPRPSTRLSTTDELPTVAANRGTEPKKLSGVVRGELDWIVMKALEKDRNRRYESANGFAADVQRYLADEPVLACPPSTLYRLRKFARRNKATLTIAATVLLALTVTAAVVGWAVRDRVARAAESEQQEIARRSAVEGRARESLNATRGLIADNKLLAARQKLSEARAHLGDDAPSFAGLAAEIDAGDAELNRFQHFLDLIDQAHQAETAPLPRAGLATDGSPGRASAPTLTGEWDRRPSEAVPFLLKALAIYAVLEREDWNTTLAGGLLGKEQRDFIRRTIYEELIWLADDVTTRRERHGSGEKLSREAALREGLKYLARAESAHAPTRALYEMRAFCHNNLGEVAARQADQELLLHTPPTIALDHYSQGFTLFSTNRLTEAVKHFEAALHLEPTHYWSLVRLGYCWCDLGQSPEDFRTAAAIFTGCILRRPDDANAYRCRSNAYFGLERYQESLADLSRAIELGPARLNDWVNRGELYRLLGKPEKAVEEASRALEFDPRCLDAWNNRGIAYADLGQHDKALADYGKAIDLDRTYPLVWINRGADYYRQRQYDNALADLSRAIELNPRLAAAWFKRGGVYGDMGQHAKAVADLSRAIELDPRNMYAWYGRGLGYSALGEYARAAVDYSKFIGLDPRQAEGWYKRGVLYCDHLGQPARAVEDFSKVLELDPRYSNAWFCRGNAYLALGVLDKAVADYSKFLDLHPKSADGWSNRGVARERMGKLDTAIEEYSRAIELDPKQRHAWYNRGRLYAVRGQPAKAVADYSTAIELDPKNGQLWYQRGVLYCDRLHQPARAVSDFSKAIELNPRDAETWKHRGDAYSQLGQHEKAIADYSMAIKLDPKLTQAWNNRGAVYFQLGQHDKAIADYSMAIGLDPNYVTYRVNRGGVYAQLGQHEKAVDDFSRAIELSPKNIDAWMYRGNAHLALGQYDKAVADFSEVIKLDAKIGLAWFRRGIAHSGLNHFPEAVADYRTALTLLPADAELHDALARLLATCPEPKLRDPAEAVKLAKKATELSAGHTTYWNTLGMAQYRAGDSKAALAAFDRSLEINRGGHAALWLFRAMSHRKLGNDTEARKFYDRATQWLKENEKALATDRAQAEELRRFRSEAEELLEVKNK